MKAAYFSPDTREFLRLLNTYGVRYLIVGGEAVIYYGYPRLTGDVDFFYKNDRENTCALFETLSEFWDHDIPGLDDYEELQNPGYVIQFGVPPNRIDLINSIDGVKFEEAWPERSIEKIDDGQEEIPVCFIGLAHLIVNKRATARNKDLDDLEYLTGLAS